MADQRRDSTLSFLTVFIVAGVALYAFFRLHEALTPLILAALV